MDNQQPFKQFDEQGDRILDIGQLTQLEKQEALQARQLHRNNMTKKQKGFKGERAFIAKPAQIAFRDFDVGKSHYLIITLTNVSNAFNSFNDIRNYFEVEYSPKGKISPGISTDIRFKFLPQLNQDIHSQFTIIAETGRISYPIVCTSRKTIVRCDNPLVQFDRIIYGQSKKVTLSIRNQGSLSSKYSFLNPDSSEVGSANTSEQLLFIQNLQFERRGQISGNSFKTISFEFRPKQIGAFEVNLQLSMKNGLHSPPIPIKFTAHCVQVPVFIQHQLYNLQICLLGHIYRQKLTFFNRSETAMSFRMSQPSQTKKYFEFNPVIGYIQKGSSLDVWIKFTADKDISLALNRFQTQPGEYVIPFQMIVKEQVLPVDFKLRFKVTSDHVAVRPSQINFGKLYEGLSSRVQLQFQNQSQLPQQILLHPLGKNLSVQNDQPLLKLLPLQTLKTAVIYHSKKLQEGGRNYREEDNIGCRMITGELATKKFDIRYVCEVVRADLAFTNNKIELPALQEGETVSATTRISNNSSKEIIYELFVPDQLLCGLRVTPVVALLQPKQIIELSVQYNSQFKTLSPSLLKQVTDKKKVKTESPTEKPAQEPEKPKKDTKKQAKLTKQQQEQLQLQQKQKEEELRLKKEKQQAERLQLERNFNMPQELTKIGGKMYDFGQTQHYQWLLPVYFKQKDYSDVSVQVNFLQITTTTIKGVLDIDCKQIDFGEVAVGSRKVQQLTLTNRGELGQLKKKSMPVFCSFNVLNSLKQISQNGTFKAVVQFQPIQEQRFQHKLQFYTDKYTVSCMLKGKGVRPQVTIQPENGLVSMGGVLIDEYSQKTVKIKNSCNFEVAFTLQKIGGGIMNSNAGSAFSYIPSHGTLPANGTVDIKIKYKPDRIGERFFEKIKVQQQKSVKYFYVVGSCYSRQAYVSDYKPLVMPSDQTASRKVQYVFDGVKLKDEDSVYGPVKKSMKLEYAREVEQGKQDLRTQRKLVIGSCRLLDNKLQKPTNFQVIMPKQDRFQCDNLKGTVVAGSQSVITFTYKPDDADPLLTCIPELTGLGQWRQLKGQLKLSGGFAKPGVADQFSLQVILKYYVSQL